MQLLQQVLRVPRARSEQRWVQLRVRPPQRVLQEQREPLPERELLQVQRVQVQQGQRVQEQPQLRERERSLRQAQVQVLSLLPVRVRLQQQVRVRLQQLVPVRLLLKELPRVRVLQQHQLPDSIFFRSLHRTMIRECALYRIPGRTERP